MEPVTIRIDGVPGEVEILPLDIAFLDFGVVRHRNGRESPGGAVITDSKPAAFLYLDDGPLQLRNKWHTVTDPDSIETLRRAVEGGPLSEPGTAQ